MRQNYLVSSRNVSRYPRLAAAHKIGANQHAPSDTREVYYWSRYIRADKTTRRGTWHVVRISKVCKLLIRLARRICAIMRLESPAVDNRCAFRRLRVRWEQDERLQLLIDTISMRGSEDIRSPETESSPRKQTTSMQRTRSRITASARYGVSVL